MTPQLMALYANYWAMLLKFKVLINPDIFLKLQKTLFITDDKIYVVALGYLTLERLQSMFGVCNYILNFVCQLKKSCCLAALKIIYILYTYVPAYVCT